MLHILSRPHCCRGVCWGHVHGRHAVLVFSQIIIALNCPVQLGPAGFAIRMLLTSFIDKLLVIVEPISTSISPLNHHSRCCRCQRLSLISSISVIHLLHSLHSFQSVSPRSSCSVYSSFVYVFTQYFSKRIVSLVYTKRQKCPRVPLGELI